MVTSQQNTADYQNCTEKLTIPLKYIFIVSVRRKENVKKDVCPSVV